MSESDVGLFAAETNVLDGVEVRILSASSETIEIEVTLVAEHDVYVTNIETDDRVWLGESRWLVVENLSPSDELVNEWAGPTQVATLRRLTSEEDLEAPGDARIDNLGELAADVELRFLHRNG